MSWPIGATAFPLGDQRYAHDGVRPASVPELQEAVRAAVARGDAIYPQGGRTSLDYGGPPGRPGVAVDLRALDRVIDYPAADMTITVEAGITLASLQSALASEGQWLTLEAPHADEATLGGIYATNTCGPRRFGLGRPRDQIIGVSFVTSDGEVVKGGGRVVKNVAGYDFPKLLTGSLGTLGIITQMTLRVRPRPETSALALIQLHGPTVVSAALGRLNTSLARPVALELLNRAAAERVHQDLLPQGDWLLVVGFEGTVESVGWQLAALGREVGANEFPVLFAPDADAVWTALTTFQDQPASALSFVASLRPSASIGFGASLPDEKWAVQIHAGNGIVRAHSLGSSRVEDFAKDVERLRGVAVEAGGNLTLSRCPAEWKERLGVWGAPRPDWEISRRVKHALDPIGALNPGRFVATI